MGLVIIILILIVAILALKVVKIFAISYKKKIDIAEQDIYLNYSYNKDDIKIVDTFIEESFDKYKLFNIAYRDIAYITDRMQSDMIEYILTDVLKSLSPALTKKLSFLYGKEHMQDIILEKIQLTAIELTTSINNNGMI